MIVDWPPGDTLIGNQRILPPDPAQERASAPPAEGTDRGQSM